MDTKINETVEMQTRDNLMEAGDLSTNGVPPKPQPKGLLSRTWARRDGIPLRDKPPPGGTITNTQNGRYQLGNAVQGERDMDQFNSFVKYNTFTMILSLAIVLLLVSGFPLLMWVLTIATLFTVVCMVATYLQSLGMMAPDMKSSLLLLYTHEQHTPTVPTSAVRNTGGRSGPQGLKDPTPDEVLRELCDKNYHQLLPLIAKKIQKEKEKQDMLNAVKARLLYGNETRKNQRNHEESHYSESKTPTARTEPKRRHGNWSSRSPSPVIGVFKRLKQNRPPSPRPRPQKEGGVFNRLGGKERSVSARSDSRHQGSHEKEIEVQPRKHHHRGTSSRETGRHSESEESEGGHWKSNQEDTGQTPTKMIDSLTAYTYIATLMQILTECP
ncbi:reverse transcriptase domain-containing protein [Tanacetum coccineum]